MNNRRLRVDEELGTFDDDDDEEISLRAAEASYKYFRGFVLSCCLAAAGAISWCAWRVTALD